MEVSSDRIPDNNDADITISQSTLFTSAAVPIIAMAVCAIVFIARIPAALHHFITLPCNNNPSLPIYKKAIPPLL